MGDDHVVPKRDAAVVNAAAGDRTCPVMIGLGVHLPQQLALPVAGINLVNGTPAVGDVHHPVLNDGRTLQPTMRPDPAAFNAAQGHSPGDLQAFHRITINLAQRRETVGRVGTMMQQPVALLLVRIEQAVLRDLVGSRWCPKQPGERSTG